MKTPSFAICFLTNLVGVILVFYFAYDIVRFARMEQRDYYDASDSITFLAHVFPVLLVCFLVDVFWVVRASVEIFRRRDYLAFAAFCIALGVWAASLLVVRLVL